MIGLTFMLICADSARAHQGENHEIKPAAPEKPFPEEQLKAINKNYLNSVKAIFKRSCFDCHSSTTNFPWYSNLPGAKQLIQSDIKEAKAHMDKSEDFPFKGHGSPKEDLEAIKKAVVDGSMPPFRYRVMHPGSKLSADEIKAIQEWVDSSLKLLE